MVHCCDRKCRVEDRIQADTVEGEKKVKASVLDVHQSSNAISWKSPGFLLGGFYCFPSLEEKGLGGYGVTSHYPLCLSLVHDRTSSKRVITRALVPSDNKRGAIMFTSIASPKSHHRGGQK